MKVATLALIVRKRKVLLGLKRGGSEIGEDTYNGPGGKREGNEALIDCLRREVWEEVRLRISRGSTKRIALIIFFADSIPDFAVHVYRITGWKGRPRTTPSMLPSWHDINHLPFRRMLSSDRTWLARAARGRRFRAHVQYRKQAKGFLGINFFPFAE